MKRSPQIIRVAVLLVGMLATGVVIGRLTAPQTPPAPSPERIVERTSTRLTELYGIPTTNTDQLRQIMARMEEEMRPHLRGSVERRDIFRKYVPEIRVLVPEEKLEAFKEHVQAMERKFRRKIRRRENP